jgi:hypothetical protein
MALGHIRKGDYSILIKEAWVGLLIGVLMFIAGFIRVYVMQQELISTLAVACSQFMIVVSSIVIGASLPLLLDKIGLDPAHAGPMIQVLMDVSGVLITCAVCSYMVGDTPQNGQDSNSTHTAATNSAMASEIRDSASKKRPLNGHVAASKTIGIRKGLFKHAVGCGVVFICVFGLSMSSFF